MQLRDTRDEFGVVTRWLHWSTAAAIAIMLMIGWFAESLPESLEPAAMGFHVGLGVALLGVWAVRVPWRAANRERPRTADGVTALIARAVQWALLIALGLMPLSGWLLVSADGHAPDFFGLFSLPPLVSESDSVHEFAEEAHELLAWTLVGLVGVHVLGALKHHLLDRDATLRRMFRTRARVVKHD